MLRKLGTAFCQVSIVAFTCGLLDLWYICLHINCDSADHCLHGSFYCVNSVIYKPSHIRSAAREFILQFLDHLFFPLPHPTPSSWHYLQNHFFLFLRSNHAEHLFLSPLSQKPLSETVLPFVTYHRLWLWRDQIIEWRLTTKLLWWLTIFQSQEPE